jgi:hypothetical protein
VLETTIGGARRARIGYELDDVSLVPSRARGRRLVDVSWKLDAYELRPAGHGLTARRGHLAGERGVAR